MVEQIEGVHAEAELMRFLDREPLLQGDVPVLLIRRTERIARRGAETGRPGVDPTVNSGETRNEGCGTEASRIQVVFETVLSSTSRISVRNATTQELRRADRGSKDATAGAIGY